MPTTKRLSCRRAVGMPLCHADKVVGESGKKAIKDVMKDAAISRRPLAFESGESAAVEDGATKVRIA
jgi:hypothetical protein